MNRPQARLIAVLMLLATVAAAEVFVVIVRDGAVNADKQLLRQQLQKRVNDNRVIAAADLRAVRLIANTNVTGRMVSFDLRQILRCTNSLDGITLADVRQWAANNLTNSPANSFVFDRGSDAAEVMASYGIEYVPGPTNIPGAQ